MESPDNSPIYKIAAEISNADAKLLSEISECLIHTSDYFHKHLENYETAVWRKNATSTKFGGLAWWTA